MPHAVILVPRREDGGHRDRVWAWVRAWWEANLPELPIFEGYHVGGLFNRSAAVNKAARAAYPWDVALIIDSDVICDPEQVREALDYALIHDRLTLPFERRHNLTQAGSEKVMAGERGSWRSFIGRTYVDMCSSAVAISRNLWGLTGGFDESFSGWGFEDSAFSLVCETFSGRTLHKIPGELWHLWHPTAPEGKRGTPSYQANRARMEQYRIALGDPKATRALIHGEDLPVPRDRAMNIPRILHRVVPATTSPEVEGYWKRFQALNPGWEYLTHRDPLKASEWPLSSPGWGSCTSGAQLAGLVRLEALYRWGGVYVDSDCEPYRSLEPLLGARAFAAWEDERTVPDAVIGAEPEHPVILACLKLALERVTKGAWESGPGVTTELLPGRSDVLLLPPGSFYPYHWANKNLRRDPHWKRLPWVFMAHHWAGSWLDKKGEQAG